MASDSSFEDWCRRLRQSDREAYAAVFDAMHAPLFRYVRSITNDPSAARDITQDVFVKLWESRRSLDPDQSLKAYLYRTARNRAYNHERNRRTRTDKEADVRTDSPAQPTPRTAPDEAVDARMLDQRLRRWIDDLPDRQREALSLSRFEGLSHEAIAEIMDISPRTVNNHIVRALKSLRQNVHAYEPGLLDP